MICILILFDKRLKWIKKKDISAWLGFGDMIMRKCALFSLTAIACRILTTSGFKWLQVATIDLSPMESVSKKSISIPSRFLPGAV